MGELSDVSPARKPKKLIYDKEDDFDMLLNDFKNYQLGKPKGQKEEE